MLFPSVNDRTAIKAISGKMQRGAYVILAAGVLLLAAIVGSLAWLLS